MSLSNENYDTTVFTNSRKFDDGKKKEQDEHHGSLPGRSITSNLELDNLFSIPVHSIKESVAFAKNFTHLALSVISYTRGLFPIYAYANKKFKGLTIKVLNGRDSCEEAHLVWKWMRSAFKALEKGYMKELIFEVLTVEDAVVEYYALEYGYDENNINCSIMAADKTIVQFDPASFQATFTDLFASIISFIKDLKPLPTVYKLQLRINYYDAKTPESYLPDYFRDECYDPNVNKGVPYMSSMGSMKTPFHHLTVRMASTLKRQNEESEQIADQQPQKRVKAATEVQPTQIEQQSTRVEGSKTQSELEQAMNQDEDKGTQRSNEPHSYEKSIEPYMPLSQPQFSKDVEGQSNAQHTIKGQSPTTVLSGPSSPVHTKPKYTPTLRKSGSEEYNFPRIVQINCICKLNDNARALFECFHCRKWHHLVCYKRKSTFIINPTLKYTCAKCAIEDGRAECLDPTMAAKNVPLKHIEDLAVYRQVIFRLQWFTMINVKILERDFRIRQYQAHRIISKLIRKSILTPCTRSEDYTLNTNQLMAFVNSYFK